jgi:hypothetical protein
VLYKDEIVIYRVLTANARSARRFLRQLKERLKESFHQKEILIVERDVETLGVADQTGRPAPETLPA